MLTREEANILIQRCRESKWTHEEYLEVYRSADRWSQGSKARADTIQTGLPTRIIFQMGNKPCPESMVNQEYLVTQVTLMWPEFRDLVRLENGSTWTKSPSDKFKPGDRARVVKARYGDSMDDGMPVTLYEIVKI